MCPVPDPAPDQHDVGSGTGDIDSARVTEWYCGSKLFHALIDPPRYAHDADARTAPDKNPSKEQYAAREADTSDGASPDLYRKPPAAAVPI